MTPCLKKKGESFVVKKKINFIISQVNGKLFYLQVLLDIRDVISDKIASLGWFCFVLGWKENIPISPKKVWPKIILEYISFEPKTKLCKWWDYVKNPVTYFLTQTKRASLWRQIKDLGFFWTIGYVHMFDPTPILIHFII